MKKKLIATLLIGFALIVLGLVDYVSCVQYNITLKHNLGKYVRFINGDETYFMLDSRGQQPSAYADGLMPHEVGWDSLYDSLAGGALPPQHSYIASELNYYELPGDSDVKYTASEGIYSIGLARYGYTLFSLPTDDIEWRYFNVLLHPEDEETWRTEYRQLVASGGENVDEQDLFRYSNRVCEQLGGAYYVRASDIAAFYKAYKPDAEESPNLFSFHKMQIDGENATVLKVESMTHYQNYDISLYLHGIYIAPSLYRQVEWATLDITLLIAGVALIVGGVARLTMEQMNRKRKNIV